VLAGHLSHRTTYGAWIWPFLAALAVGGPNQQSAAQRPLLYKELLEARSSLVDGIVRAKRPEPLPVVLTREDIGAVPQRFDIVPRLMAAFLYGAGLRLLEWRGA
jgi:integrase